MTTPKTLLLRTESQLEARRKMREAMKLIEHAQRLLGMAAEELCPIQGLLPEWKKAGKAYDDVKALWYRIEAKTEAGFDLDADSRLRFQAPAKPSATPTEGGPADA